MDSYNVLQSSQSFAPSAPSLLESFFEQNHFSAGYIMQQEHQLLPSSYSQGYYSQQQPPSYGSGYGQGSSSYGSYSFTPGTHTGVIRSFQMVDRDRSGDIDDEELQEALCSGTAEFAALWSCLGQWRAIFERYDKDRSGKINQFELRDALYGIGYAVPSSVLKITMDKSDDRSGGKIELNFDSSV